MAASRPRQAAVLELGAHDGGEQPGADDVVGLGPQVHGEDPGEEVGVVLPPAGDLRGERRGGPGVHDVGVADEPAGLAPLVLGVAVGHVGRRVDGQAVLGGQDGVVVVDLAVVVDRVPDREGHPEEPLAADVPVAVEALHPAR